jgi:hypothetical protein
MPVAGHPSPIREREGDLGNVRIPPQSFTVPSSDKYSFATSGMRGYNMARAKA